MISTAYSTSVVTPHTGRLETRDWWEIPNVLRGAGSAEDFTERVGGRFPIYPGKQEEQEDYIRRVDG